MPLSTREFNQIETALDAATLDDDTIRADDAIAIIKTHLAEDELDRTQVENISAVIERFEMLRGSSLDTQTKRALVAALEIVYGPMERQPSTV